MKLYAKIYLIAFALLVVVLFVLPFFSFSGYSIAKNTISELGAQKVSGNWLANLAIILLSIATALLITRQLKLYWKQLIAGYFFCTSFLLTGIYHLAGFDAHTHIFNYTNDALHSLFSFITGFAFCIFSISILFITEKKHQKWQTFAVFLVAFASPFLMWQYPEYKGIFQRILYLVTFGWLFYALTTYQFQIKNNAISRMKRYNKLYENFHKNEK